MEQRRLKEMRAKAVKNCTTELDIRSHLFERSNYQIQKRKRRSARIDLNDTSQQICSKISSHESMTSTVGSQFSITTNGEVSARIELFKNFNNKSAFPDIRNQSQQKEKRGDEAVKLLQQRVIGALMKYVCCENPLYQTEMVLINDKSPNHRDCLVCDWCGKVIS